MGLGHSSHQPSKRDGELVPHRQNFKLSGLPLLPYERQLIDFLEISEAEYRQYRADLINSGKPRPAEYGLVPDVQAGPATPFLVQIAIGLVLTGIGILLAPKPQAPKRDEREQLKLADQTGQSRFNSIGGFNASQQIAELGATIPIPFGRYEEFTRDGHTYSTGGLMASPQLVWSRMFSYGTHQGFKGLYVIGECLNDTAVFIAGKDDPTKPDEAGIQIGTLPLDALPDQQQAVYWNTNYQDARVKSQDLIYGTRATPAAGDPQTNDDIFNCPVLAEPEAPGFCMTYSPGGDTSFGFHSPISNGMGFMMNFRIIPMPSLPGDDDPGDRIKMERRKIAGKAGDTLGEGMGTTGRGYSSQMGIISLNGWEPSDRETLVDVNVGDEIRFWIRKECINQDNVDLNEGDGSLKANDVNNAINSRRAAADDALQIGETFMIGRTIWQVINRTQAVWRPDTVNDEGNGSLGGGQEVYATLKMIETTTGEGATKIGLPGKRAIETFVTWEGGDLDETLWNGPSFWALGNASLAVIRNVRPAEVTEFGIKSQVWNQANGLCNFSNLPTAEELAEYESDGNTLTSGAMSLYYKRTSCFTLWIRPVSETATNYPWKPIGEQYCVTGSQPVDQYNFIRVTDLSGQRDSTGRISARQMEFRFIPKNSAELSFLANSGEVFIRLNAKTGAVRQKTYTTDYGDFMVHCVGDEVVWDDADPERSILYNDEYWTSGRKGSSVEETRPSEARTVEVLGDSPIGRLGSYCAFLNGNKNPDDYQNQTITADHTIDKGDKSITCRFYLTTTFIGSDSEYYEVFDREWYFYISRIEVLSVDGDWGDDEQFEDLASDSNHYSDIVNQIYFDDEQFEYGFRFAISAVVTEIVNRPESAARRFGGKTQINTYSLYDEVNCSASSGPEHAIVYVNETVTPVNVPIYAFTSMGLAVRSSNQLNSIEQVRVWIGDGVRVKRWEDGTFGPSNLFSDLVYYLLTDKIAGLGTWNSNGVWTNTSTFEATSKFLKANGIKFDGTVEQKVNLRSYLTQLAPLNLCNFVIANGQFSIIPALPFDPNSYQISADALEIKAVFSSGNIVEGSYKLEYLDRAERENIKAVMVYRNGKKNKLPQSDAILVRWKDVTSDRAPQTVFDMTNFCTDKEQAKLVGRYMLSLKRRIDHAINFQTLPLGLSLAPGDYIRVITEDAPNSDFSIGAVSPQNGQILSVMELADGSHEVTAYVPGSDAVRLITMEVLNGRVTDPALYGTLFTTLTLTEHQNTYIVEQLELGEDGMVNVTASFFPTDEQGRSLLALDALDEPLADGSSRFMYVD